MVSALRIRQICILLVATTTCYVLYNSFYLATYDAIEAEKIEHAVPVEVNIVGEVDGSRRDEKDSAKKKFQMSDQTCNIPKLDINGSEVISFFHKPKQLRCEKKNPINWMFINEERKLQLIESKKDAVCKVGYVIRKNDSANIEEEISRVVKEGDQLEHDFARIQCTTGKAQWSGLLMNVAGDPSIRERCQQRKREKETLNVYFMGFDSLSQMSFRRNLPKTVEFLEKTMEAVVLNGYNIVGDGTPQAYIPILTAKTEEELPLTRKRYSEANYVDDVYPFIWANFSDAGYVTAYGEDAFNIGTFTYRLKGFRKQPTDHFTRTMFKEVEKKSYSQWNCLGSEPLHQNWFRYTREFMREYVDLPRFILMHQSLLSHDDINLVNVEDYDLSSHLSKMYENGEFENTLVVVMADHGHRFAQLRSTHQGQLEERLPFFSLALPKNFRETEKGAKIYENLKLNRDRLSTPFDIHATLMDILNPPDMDDLQIEQKATQRLIPNDGLLKYKNVMDADGFVPDLSGTTTASFAHFQLKLATTPGRAIYEVTLFYDFHNKSPSIDLTSISHVNKFGDDPHCIIDQNYFLATYCVCHDRIK